MMKFDVKWKVIMGIGIISICALVASSQFFHLFILDELGVLSLSTFLMVVIIEAIVFYRFGWTWKRSLTDALLLNFISTVVSIVVFTLFFLIISPIIGAFYPSLLTATYDFYSVCTLYAVIIILEFLLSVTIEFYTLKLTHRGENQAKFRRTVIAANLWSLPVMILSWIIAIFFAILRSSSSWDF
jgi:hypothetical protein